MAQKEAFVAVTIRVDERVHAKLRDLSRAERRSMGELIADAIDRYEHDKFWDDVESSVERVRADPDALRAYENEIRLLEGGSMDGLEHEPPYYTPEELEALLGKTTNSPDR